MLMRGIFTCATRTQSKPPCVLAPEVIELLLALPNPESALYAVIRRPRPIEWRPQMLVGQQSFKP